MMLEVIAIAKPVDKVTSIVPEIINQRKLYS